MLDASHHPHPVIPGQPLQAKERAVGRQACDRYGGFLPLKVEIMEPEVGDVAADGVNGLPPRLPFFAESAADRKPLVENYLVEKPRGIGILRRHHHGQDGCRKSRLQKFSSTRHGPTLHRSVLRWRSGSSESPSSFHCASPTRE